MVGAKPWDEGRRLAMLAVTEGDREVLEGWSRRRRRDKVFVALANKIARVAWTILKLGHWTNLVQFPAGVLRRLHR